MTKEVKLTIPGKAVPNNTEFKTQFAVNPITGKAYRKIGGFKPDKVKKYKKLIQSYVMEYCLKNPSFNPFDVPVELTLWIYRKVPKSYSKKKREELLRDGGMPAGKKPDTLNNAKVIEDSISYDAWNKSGYYLIKNDSLVCDTHCYKRYAESDYIEIILKAL